MPGRLKVFLGMAAGVGKTYRMLQEGQAEAEAGRDVAIGWLEPHDRAETSAQAAGLEVVPRRRVVYQGTSLQEMDLPAVLRRAPELCLIDELAHTNAPGVEHAKRCEDVADVLAAGIDVYSTVNVQHLESLNDQIAEATGTRVRETIPDGVLAEANEIVLIDLSPEALIERLRAGKVYDPARVDAALQGFFRIEHLASLREVALRQVAEEVGARGVARAPVGERLLALVTPRPASQRVVRRAWRSAQRLGAELDLLWVQDHAPDADEREQLDALRRLAVVLGAHLLVEHGEDVVAVARRVAQERETTYVLIGTPAHRNLLSRARGPSLPSRLLGALPGIDVRIVADRARRA